MRTPSRRLGFRLASVKVSRTLPALAAALVLACGGDPVRGGSTADGRAVRPGKLVATLAPHSCRDARGGAFAWGERSTVSVFESSEKGSQKRRLLMEQVPGFDALVVKNVFVDGGDQVFQVVTESDRGSPLLREFRLRRDGGGRLTVARAFTLTKQSEGFRGRYQRPIMVCELGPPGAGDETRVDAGGAEAPMDAPLDAGQPLGSTDAAVD